MSLPQIPTADRDQAINDILEAMAMQEAALASVINAEAAKVDALVAAGIPAAESIEQVNAFQGAVAAVLQLAAQKDQAINQKLELLRSLIAHKSQAPNP